MLRIALALVLAFVAVPAAAMTFEASGAALLATGKIEQGDDAKFAAAVSASQPRDIVVQSPGGYVNEAQAMASLIRDRDLRVIVRSRCVSACVLLFLAGTSRAVIAGGVVGVHSATVDGKETPAAAYFTVTLARRYASLGAPASVVAKMVTTLPSGMTLLTADDLAALGASIIAAP